MCEEDIKTIKRLSERLKGYTYIPGLFRASLNGSFIVQLRSELQAVNLIEKDHPTLKSYFDISSKALICYDQGRRPWINPIALGQIITVLDTTIEEEKVPTCWQCIHPAIQKASKQLYMDGHYANAAEDAFIEINDRAKGIYKQIRPEEKDIPDGVNLMNQLFGKNALVELADIHSETGANIQQGYHFMFSGSMSALRNPKAHTNTIVLSASEALRRIMFASMLMYQLDEVNKDYDVSKK